MTAPLLEPRLKPDYQVGFQNGIPLGMTFTRASTGSYFDSAGILQYASNDVSRHDHDPITGEPLGILREDQRTNEHNQSIMSGTGTTPDGWLAGEFGGGGNGIPSIFGTDAQAWEFNVTAARAFVTHSINLLANTTYSYSILVEKNDNGIAANNLILPSNLPSGVTLSWPKGSSYVPSAGERFYVNVIVGATAGVGQFRVGVGCAANTTGYAVVSRPQVEVGPFPSSFILTDGSTATRAKDDIRCFCTEWFNPVGGTFMIEAALTGFTGSFQAVCGFSDSNTVNTNAMYFNATNTPNFTANAFSSGVNKFTNGSIGSPVVDQFFKGAISYKDGDCDFVVDGNVENSGSFLTMDVPVNLDVLTLGRSAFLLPDNDAFIHIKRFLYWNRKLSNTELQRITT